MLLWIIQITIISIIFIILVHHLIEFFKNTLTIPKIKDLVNSSSQKYENIYNTIKNNQNPNQNQNQNQNPLQNTEYTLIDLLPKEPQQELEQEKNINMKSELKNFLKRQMNPPLTKVEPNLL